MNLSEQIASKYPKSFKYFSDFYENEYPHKIEGIHFNTLAFEYQLGIYILFFDKINSDVQLYSTSSSVLKECILEAFSTYEEYLFLDS